MRKCGYAASCSCFSSAVQPHRGWAAIVCTVMNGLRRPPCKSKRRRVAASEGVPARQFSHSLSASAARTPRVALLANGITVVLSWAASTAPNGRSSSRSSSMQLKHGDVPGMTSGPTLTLRSLSRIGRWATSLIKSTCARAAGERKCSIMTAKDACSGSLSVSQPCTAARCTASASTPWPRTAIDAFGGVT